MGVLYKAFGFKLSHDDLVLEMNQMPGGKFIPGVIRYAVHWSYCRKGFYFCLVFSLAQCKG